MEGDTGGSRNVWIAVAAIIVVVIVIVATLFFAGLLFAPPEENGNGPPPPPPPAVVKIGTVLPQTGTLSDFGPRMKNAADLAGDEINAAGGILGRDLTLIHEDTQTRPAQGANVAAKLIFTDGVTAIVGAASSGVSQGVATLTLENNIIQISPASTSPLFTTLETDRHAALIAAGLIPNTTVSLDTPGNPGWWWRSAPSDALQGKVAGMVANGDFAGIGGWANIAIIAVNNPYGKGFAGAFLGTYTGTLTAQVNYTEEQATYASELLLISTSAPGGAAPDAVLLIGYPEDALTMHKNYLAAGYTWAWQWSEGLKSTEFLTDLATNAIDPTGIVGTTPLPPAGAAFDDWATRMNDTYGLDLFPFDAHTYDAVMLIALAMEQADSTASDDIRTNLNSVSSPPGTKVFPGEYKKAIDLIAAGTAIDYDGASGALNFDVVGEVGSNYQVFNVEGGAFVQVTVVLEENITLAPPAPSMPAPPNFVAPPPSLPTVLSVGREF